MPVEDHRRLAALAALAARLGQLALGRLGRATSRRAFAPASARARASTPASASASTSASAPASASTPASILLSGQRVRVAVLAPPWTLQPLMLAQSLRDRWAVALGLDA